jgi:hypothetical protein
MKSIFASAGIERIDRMGSSPGVLAINIDLVSAGWGDQNTDATKLNNMRILKSIREKLVIHLLTNLKNQVGPNQ